ncbi:MULTISPECIES: secondary thiamine-phosphate synthase enzyme YjbQ [Aphanizomenonaceae]|uniref:Secondary thiamine-phosphate synthase enzyme YjbQ n=1 Tax=Dolichospermum heterosporum TAC447 TaxID=747523 RepID=A0ABY5LS07_9CYAN|nr:MULTISPECIES: secondary thiamine-phosphate synthase enzyme YjbQ [Aphanizomenonaceae]MBE9259260.1 YjbQ family protein [Dolichospermum sp. LEGE 00246]UUO14748.1 secondary thiamine-phosphate synthase enzyme YjbQ [Dolichospermum heterosporum TAC447]
MTNSSIRLYQQSIKVQTTGKSLCQITPQVQAVITESEITAGICNLFIRHTSASLLIQEEDAKPDVETFFAKLVPENGQYLLAGQGLDDMPAHIRSALTHTSEQVPIAQGLLQLGRLQDIYIWEHRQSGYIREVVINILGY